MNEPQKLRRIRLEYLSIGDRYIPIPSQSSTCASISAVKPHITPPTNIIAGSNPSIKCRNSKDIPPFRGVL